MANTTKFFIITGEPGVGKTTLIKKLVTSLATEGVKTSGFYTEEVRRNGTRDGFDVVSLDGARGRLARDETQLKGSVKHRVGKYGVLVQEFEAVALPSLEKTVPSMQPQMLVIDEIGKMEFFSTFFKSKVMDIFSQTSDKMVLATIPSRRSDSIIEKIRNSVACTKLWIVTRENRNSIQQDILKELRVTIKLVQLQS